MKRRLENNRLSISLTSNLNFDNLPTPTLPPGSLGMERVEFLRRTEWDEAFRSYQLPPDVEGYVFRKKHWAENAPREICEAS